MNKPIKILFVCMGNICRSPTSHGVFQRLVNELNLSERFIIESAGTIGYHVGEPADTRACAVAKQKGTDLSALRARKVTAGDYSEQDYIVAMDFDNLNNLRSDCAEEFHSKLSLLLDYHPDSNLEEVPDPYYGDGGFENVYNMIEIACHNLLDHIKEKHL